MFRFCHVCLYVPHESHSTEPLPLKLIEHLHLLIGKKMSNISLWLCWRCSHLLKKYIAFRDLCLQSSIFIENNLDKLKFKNELNSKRKEIEMPLIITAIDTIDIMPVVNDADSSNEYTIHLNKPSDSREDEEEIKDVKNIFLINETELISFTDDDDDDNYMSDEKLIVYSKKKIDIRKEKKMQKFQTKKSVYNTPSKNFDSSMIIVKYLSEEKQREELENIRRTEEYLKSPYKCEMCAKGFAHEIVYKDHQEKHEPVSGQYICNLCNQRFTTKRNLCNHMDTHAYRFTCRLCNKVLISKQNIMTHIYTEHDETNKEVKCDLCQKIYKNRYSYTKHMKIHNSSKQHKCHLCHKVFLWKDNLNRHLTRHKSEKLFKCDLCSKSFFLKENLKDHQLVHSNEKRFYCVECDLSYATQVKLNQHLRRGTRHLKPEQLTFACKLCDKKYTNNQQLSMHMDRIHLNKRSQACQLCDAAFVSKKTLQTHVKTIHEGYEKPKNHICETCGKGFSNKQVLNAHLRTHTGEKPYSCKYCGVKFAHSGALYTHVKLVHLKLKRTTVTKKRHKEITNNKTVEISESAINDN